MRALADSPLTAGETARRHLHMFVVRQLATPAARLTFFSPRGRFRPGGTANRSSTGNPSELLLY